jgi:hypothetical protein
LSHATYALADVFRLCGYDCEEKWLMIIHLWHFTWTVANAKRVRDEGFQRARDRDPCFSVPGETFWKESHGPALVEVWLDIDEQELAVYECGVVDGGRHIVFYTIPVDVVNARKVEMHVYANADDLLPPVVGWPALRLYLSAMATVSAFGATI